MAPSLTLARYPVLAAGLLLVASAWPLAAQPSRPAGPWKFDVIHLKSGKVWQGQLLKETAAGVVTFLPVHRSPGEPTRLLPVTTFEAKEIDHIDRLADPERQQLAERLARLSPAGEKQRLEQIALQAVPWEGAAAGGLAYRSRYFTLLSDASDDVVRRAADRLEQIYAGYANFLPPRRPRAQPTTIRMVRSPAEYTKLLEGRSLSLLNPAFYDAGANEILCVCDLQQLNEQRKGVREEHRKLLTRLRTLKEALERQYRGRIPEDRRRELERTRQEIQHEIEVKDQKNAKVFQDATRRLFQTLYHEAFHAYLAGFVYPPGETSVPRWLNEGLAQIFEAAVPEDGELRVGRPDLDRLARARAALCKGELVSLADLLRSGPEQFLVGHASDQQVSDRYYLASWALAFYLTFERKKLGTPELDAYVHTLKQGADPLAAFRGLVGEPLPKFEKAFHRYLQCLRSDGSALRLVERSSG